MESIFSRTTLYDMLSMVIPGLIVILSLAEIFWGENCVMALFGKELAVPKYMCIFAGSYLVGLFIHEIGRLLFLWCRNVPNKICCAKKLLSKELIRKEKVSDLCKRIKEKKESKKEVKKLNDSQKKIIVEEYYEDYYKVMEKHGSSISTMESQTAFLRSMLFVIPIGLRAIYRYTSPFLKPCNMAGIILVTELVVFLLMMYLQFRIYFRVFEDYYYLKIIEEKDKKKTVVEGEFSDGVTKLKVFPDKNES